MPPDDDIGVHLTLNAEHGYYRWGPITHAPSLQSGEGGFPRTLEDLWEHADHDEVLRELRAQIERAIVWGIDVTHLAPHLSAITLRPEFFDVYLELAVEFRLPIRLPSTISAEQAGFPFRTLAAEEGVVFPDHFDHDWRAGSLARVLDAIQSPRGRRHRDPRPAGDRHAGGAGGRAPSADGWIADLALVTSDDLRRAPRRERRDADRLSPAPRRDPRRLNPGHRRRSRRTTAARPPLPDGPRCASGGLDQAADRRRGVARLRAGRGSRRCDRPP